MLKHSVIFTFKDELPDSTKDDFFEAVNGLSAIPGVQSFEVLKQVSPKNNFEFGIAMEFDSDEDYNAYAVHPQHSRFIEDFWLKCVEDFLEIDFRKLT